MNESKIYIKELLAERHISYREFSNMVGTTPANISAIANGKLQPSVTLLEKWAKALDIPVTRLFGDTPSAPNTIICPCCGARFVLVTDET